MGYIEANADFDSAVMQAGDRFVTQIQPVLNPQSLAVILLDPDRDSGRVAFTWGFPHRFGNSQSPSSVPVPNSVGVSDHSLRISLEGGEGTLGAVLLRGDFPHGYTYEQPLLLQAITQQLASTLENIQLKERLRRKTVEDRALENIASLVAGSLPPGRIYARFAAEVKELTGHESITIYLADEQGGVLSSVFHLGIGAVGGASPEVRNLPGDVWESDGQGFIIQDYVELHSRSWPGPHDSGDLRSALITPIVYAGEIAGAVAVESRWPKAYGQAELSLMSKASALLGPWIASSRINERLQGKANELVCMDAVGQAVASGGGLEAVFGYIAEALNALISFEYATLSWIETDGSDGGALNWSSNANVAVYLENVGRFRLQVGLEFGKQRIGALALTRESGVEFAKQDSMILDRVALQIAPVVQDARLGRPGARRAGHPLDGASPGGAAHREILSDAARALRTPLTAIKGYSSALLQSDVSWPPDMYREFLEIIDQETDRLDQVVGRLLSTVDDQPDLPRLDLQYSSIEGLFDMVQADLGLVDWPKTVEFRCEPGLSMGPVNPSGLIQVLGHLIPLAAEFTLPDEGIRVEACRWQGRPAIVITAVSQARTGGTTHGGQQDSSVPMDGRPDRTTLVKDSRAVVSKNLLEAEGVKLRILPRGRPTEIFRFLMPR